MGFYVLLLIVSIVLPAIFLVIPAEVCRYKFGGTRSKPYFVTIVLQLLFYGILSYIVWSNFPSAAAIVGIGVISYTIVLTGLFGFALYPVVFLMVNRPTSWGLYLKRCLLANAVVILAVMSPRLVTMTGLTSNVDLYGQVVDIDGQPVANASVELRNCGYFRENPLRTDRDGIFHIVATCSGILIFDRIYNPTTQSFCVPRRKDQKYLRSVSEDPDRSRLWKKGIHWEHRLRENPLRFECIWHTPEGLREYRISSREIIPDGRPYHIAPVTKNRRKRLQLVEGTPVTGLELALFIDNPAALIENESSAGRLEVSFIGGGVQRNGSRYAVPEDGYGERAIATFDNSNRYQKKSFSFQSSTATHFGVIDVAISDRTSGGNMNTYIKIFMDRDGSRVILPDRAQHEQKLIDDLLF
jgi:hypothetical protein